jgi:hypothetical protein
MNGAVTLPSKKFAVHTMVATDLREAAAAAVALRTAGEQLLAQSRAIHANACAPVLRMLGIEEGNIIDVTDTADGPMVTVLIPAPQQEQAAA